MPGRAACSKSPFKSADPVTYDDNGNVIPLSERFNPRKEDIRFSLIGEMGARNLDIAEEATTRLDNLAVAREMEQAGKDAKTIKMATGWERGADYFWRYEVDDVRFVNPEEWVNKKGKLTLKDIVTNADELFAAYPELKDVKIKKSTAMGNGGAYNHKDNTITISLGTLRRGFEIQNNVEGFNTSKEEIDRLMDILINVELRGTLVHEIQHAIQNIEGFARGGNAKMVNPALNKDKVVAFEQEMINQINEKVHQYNSMSTMERRTPKGSQLRVQIQEGKKKLAKFQKEIVLGKEGYRKLAGEVEARNIEKRLGLTPEERRATLAESTEDVARDDQIFILYGAEVAEKMKGNADRTPSEFRQPITKVGNPSLSHFGAKLRKDFETAIEELEEKINQKGKLGDHEFLYELDEALSEDPKIEENNSDYVHIGEGVTLRLSDHYANGKNFKDYKNQLQNFGIVVLPPKDHRNKSIFKGLSDVEYIEYVYYPDKMDLERQKDILQGIKEFIKTKDFNKLPKPDNTHISPKPKSLLSLRQPPAEMADIRSSVSDFLNEDVRFSIRTSEPPTNTGIGYKVFVLKDGKLYPPKVANPNGEDTPVGVWLDADEGVRVADSKTGRPQVKSGGKGTDGGSGNLAYRPGWHLGEIPYALQFNRNDENGVRSLFPANFVWAEVEYANDVDYQEEAMSYGYNKNGKFQHSYAGLPRIPENGSYKYRTNPNPQTDPWIITGAMRVRRLLTPTEVDEIVKAAGREPQVRQKGAITDAEVKTLNKQLGLEATQIKSATDNAGTYSSENPDSRFALRNMVPTNKPVTYDNFFNSTAGIWETLPISEVPTREPDYVSQRWDGFGVSSRYWYGEDDGGQYVIRESDHWSGVLTNDSFIDDFERHPYSRHYTPIASCRWALDGQSLKGDNYREKVENLKSTFGDDSGSIYGKIYLRSLTHYKDADVRRSLRDVEPLNEQPLYSIKAPEDILEQRLKHNEGRIEKGFIAFRRKFEDYLIEIKRLQEALQMNGVEINGDNDFYAKENAASSVAEYAMGVYERNTIAPLTEWMRYLQTEYGLSIEDITDYLLAKHSLERHDSGLNAINPDDDA